MIGDHLGRLELTDHGHGWMWADRRGLFATRNDGRSWTLIASKVVTDDSNEVLSGSVLPGGTGFLVISQPLHAARCDRQRCGPELLTTTDDGKTWKALQAWPGP
jgi:hypothetical protein